MDLSSYKYVYLIGIGGIGMSALARYFQSAGCLVAGYDRSESALTRALQSEGMQLHFEDNTDHIPQEIKNALAKEVLVIYTPAVPKAHKELNHFQQAGYMVKKRAEILAALTKNKFTIAVAGTHGKTSTATTICHILKTANVPFYGFLGGISANYDTNFIKPDDDREAELIVVEADEFDRSFLHLHPNIAIITAIESDHLDIYGDLNALQEAYFSFAHQLEQGGRLIAQQEVMVHKPKDGELIKYSASEPSDYHALNVHVENGRFVFDARLKSKTLNGLVMGVPGMHNIENTLAAIAATMRFVDDDQVYYEALESYRGVKRRFEVVYQDDNTIYIDDYAHHPTEIRATIQTVRYLHRDKKVLGIFQPHLYSRTRDFAMEFAASLGKLDELILLPIYPAREEPIAGVSSAMILDEVHGPARKQVVEKDKLVQEILASNAGVVLTIGAGDIDRLVEPIKEALSKAAKE